MANLEQAARDYLTARGAPITPGNISSISDFLAMNPDKMPSVGAPKSLIPENTTPANALDDAVTASMQPRNDAYLRAPSRNVARAPMPLPAAPAVAGLTDGTSANNTTLPSTSIPMPQAIPTAAPSMPTAAPYNPPEAMTGAAGESGAGDINAVIQKLLGLAGGAAVGGGAAYLASRGKVNPIESGVMKQLSGPSNATLALPKPSPKLATREAMVGTDPALKEVAPNSVASTRAVEQGRANPIGASKDTSQPNPAIQAGFKDGKTPLKNELRTRMRTKAMGDRNQTPNRGYDNRSPVG